MKNSVKYLFCLALLMLSKMTMAQNVEMADTLRSEGKIYVVVVIILIVLSGLIIYLFLLDRKLTRMEKLISEKKKTK